MAYLQLKLDKIINGNSKMDPIKFSIDNATMNRLNELCSSLFLMNTHIKNVLNTTQPTKRTMQVMPMT